MIYDALGCVVAEPSVDGTQMELDLAGWPPGVYTARLSAGSSVASRRFVIAR